MREDRTMRRFIHRLLVPAALLLAAAPARAQVGNQSDVPPTGPASGAAGSYLGPGLRTENEMFARDRGGELTVFRNAATGCALRAAERLYRDSLAAAPRTPAQARVQTLLGLLPGTPDPEAVAAALAHGAEPTSPLGRAASALAMALNGLMRDLGPCADRREAYTEAPQWQEAIRAFNAYIHTAPDAAFSPPAPELVAIHEALQTVVFRTLSSHAHP
jgi:hypothetical protein